MKWNRKRWWKKLNGTGKKEKKGKQYEKIEQNKRNVLGENNKKKSRNQEMFMVLYILLLSNLSELDSI